MRFRSRHLRRTVADWLRVELTALGWLGLGEINFDTQAFRVLEVEPEDAGGKVEHNTVMVSMGDEPPIEAIEMGGGLYDQSVALFVDVFAARPGIAVSIASDIRDLLTGRVLYVSDYTTNPPTVTAEQVEMHDVMLRHPDLTGAVGDFRRNWRIINATAHVAHQR